MMNMEDAWATYDGSLERLVSPDEPLNERIRQAFEAGHVAGYVVGRRVTDLPCPAGACACCDWHR